MEKVVFKIYATKLEKRAEQVLPGSGVWGCG
jgi:hypothetical protein